MKRIFILSVEVKDSSDKVKGTFDIIKDSIDAVLTAKDDFKNTFEYMKVEIVSVKEAHIDEDEVKENIPEETIAGEDN